VNKGVIIHVVRGIYSLQEIDPILGPINPSTEAIAEEEIEKMLGHLQKENLSTKKFGERFGEKFGENCGVSCGEYYI
jgi:hypothetical protein